MEWPALSRAANIAAGLQLVADRRGRTIAELRRGLTRRELEEEIARAVVDLGREIALGLMHDATREPPDGPSLLNRVIRAYYDRWKAAEAARLDDEADKALARQLDG